MRFKTGKADFMAEMTSKELATKIAQLLDDKKAGDVKVMHIENLTVLADYFVVCTGNATTHVKALSDEVEFKLKEEGIYPLNIEGYNAANWILMDYGSVIVHIFLEETRGFYSIERLWADASLLEIPGIGEEKPVVRF